MKEYSVKINEIIEKTSWPLNGVYKTTFSKINDDLYKNAISNEPMIYNGYNNWGQKKQDFINSEGYKSDNFQKNTKDDIVFLGCSETFGLGVLQEAIWPKIVIDKIAFGKNLNNLSLIAGSTEEIIYNFFKYCYKYGNPGTIFFLMPEVYRGFEPTHELSELRVIQFYHILEMYCKQNNILLISSSWEVEPVRGSDKSINDVFDGMFDTFYKLDKETYMYEINNFMEKNPKTEYSLVSRDGRHMGVAMHYSIGIFMINLYNKLTNQ